MERHKGAISFATATFLAILAGPASADARPLDEAAYSQTPRETRVEADKWRDVVDCRSEIWNTDLCAPMITAFKKDPYPYVTYVTKTVDAASIAIRSGGSRGLAASWNDKTWDVIVRSGELTGYLEAKNEDPRRVRVKDPYAADLESVPVFGGCYFLRDLVVDEDSALCDTFLEPMVRHFYLAMTAFRNLCGDASEPRNCDALTPYYEISSDRK